MLISKLENISCIFSSQKTMLDHSNQVSSFNPDYQMGSNYDSQSDVEFDFWGGSDARYYEHFSYEDGGEMEFRGHLDEELDDYSVGLWKRSTSRHVRNETSRLLPNNHRYSNISISSQSQAIAEARKELMERIHDMPESSYELSLKDIVDEQLTLKGVSQEDATEGTSFHFNTAATQIMKQRRKKPKNTDKSAKIARSKSMEKETFMIKMFLPISFCWKTKVKGGNGSKDSPRPSFHGSENQVDKEWGIQKLMAGGDSKRSNRTNSSSSSSSTSTGSRNSSSSTSSTSTGSRNSSSNSSFSPGCWPFSAPRKPNTRNIQDASSERAQRLFS